MSLPHAIPSVNFSVVQIVLYSSVKHKFSLMCAIFLAKDDNRFLRDCSPLTPTDRIIKFVGDTDQ